jgi:hypothetical protein
MLRRRSRMRSATSPGWAGTLSVEAVELDERDVVND